MNRKLILIKHAAPQVVEGVESRLWRLSDDGRRKAAALAEAVGRHNPAIIVTSDEPKAQETGQIIAAKLNLPAEVSPGLHEHDRSNVPHMPSREFISWIGLFFQKAASWSWERSRPTQRWSDFPRPSKAR